MNSASVCSSGTYTNSTLGAHEWFSKEKVGKSATPKESEALALLKEEFLKELGPGNSKVFK